MAVTLRQQIACAERELKMRIRVYPRWVEAGKMKQADADAEIAAMQAIVATLRTLPGSFAQESII